MNNPKILAQTMASSYLAQTWNMDVLQRAFVEKWPHQLGYALELFVPMVPRPLVDLVKLYDGAGMMKTEMASAIWQAARVHYDAEVFAQAQAVRAAAKGSLAVQALAQNAGLKEVVWMDKREARKRARNYLARLHRLQDEVRMPACILALSNEEGFRRFCEVLTYAVATAELTNFRYSRSGLMSLAEEYGWTWYETQIAEETLRLNDCWEDWMDGFWEAA